jgi:hypothetical protein
VKFVSQLSVLLVVDIVECGSRVSRLKFYVNVVSMSIKPNVNKI